MTPPHLSPTTLAQFIRLDSCERFLRFRLVPDDLERLLDRWDLTIQPLTPLLSEAGAAFEAHIAEKLAARGETVIDLRDQDVLATVQHLQAVDKPTLLYQPALAAPLGGFLCAGQADLIRLHRDRSGRLHALVADVKASRTEKTEHRLQVAVYARLLRSLCAEHGIELAGLNGTVLTRQADGSYPTLDSKTPTFDLEPYFGILDRLVVDPDSAVHRVLDAPFEAAFYHLGPKCDGCLYNAVCMVDSAERLDLALTPHITPVEKRLLLEAGVTSLTELAALLGLPAIPAPAAPGPPAGPLPAPPADAAPPPVGADLRVGPPPAGRTPRSDPTNTAAEAAGGDGRAPHSWSERRSDPTNTLAALRTRWPLGANLPFLNQRARAALHYFDPAADYRPFLIGGGFGSLPSDEKYPALVKIFFDAQRDYLQDRLYLLSALVSGPKGRETIVECAYQPPDDALEQVLLLSWIGRVIAAVAQVAAAEQAPLHLYCYSRLDQQALLEALKRCLPALAAVPAFFDLLSQGPALSQPVISFLADEITERFNPGRVCLPLHDAARWRGFDWRDDRYEYYRLFQARMFDNRRDVLHQPVGALVPATAKTPTDDPARRTIETASRFSSQVPLEYAYAAWGRLPDDPEDSHVLDPFRKVTLDMLRGFAARRVEALAHIEASFRSKSKRVEKLPLDLPRLLEPAAPHDLRRSLKEFLYLEHHTMLQARLLGYSQPLDRRVQSGAALLLLFSYCSGDNRCVFTPDFESLGLDPALAIDACKLKEGDWVVLNPDDPALSPNQIKHGRLAVIESLSIDSVMLQLLNINFHNGDFRYSHHYNLEPRSGLRYTIDPMADDLNADKVLDALDHVEGNVFFDWLLDKPGPREIRPTAPEFLEKFAAYVAELVRTRGRKLTERQREAIAGHFAEPLALIQGPPGSGKSYTVAWAVLAHIAAACIEGRPCRVLVACKTHNAILVALSALVQAQNQVGVFAPAQFGGQGIFGTEIYKVIAEAGDDLPPQVRPLSVYDQRNGLESLLARRFLVIGATSGGVYNLMRYRAAGGNTVEWTEKPFDLVVIDEASQMSLPEGVLCGAFLKPGGRMLVVGDHRQMPPIVAHDWQSAGASLRPVDAVQAYISLFEALVERGFPVVRLDESFRLHRDMAEFLRQNVYAQDGIRFHSKRKDRLHRLPPVSPYVDAALDPAYPMVVIEHTEAGSQQHNPLEVELLRPLIAACVQYLSLDGRSGLGVVVPHRAQKALLRAEFPGLAEAGSIDTVERFQGDERDVIIVSATASDPDYVRGEAEFLLNLNRLNVAISRPRLKLIVVAARTVIDLLTSDLAVFEQALIWKRLYRQYTPDVLLETNVNGYKVQVRGRKAG